MPGADTEPERRPPLGFAMTAGAGGLTMVALCFANGLQAGMTTTYSQATDVLKDVFHVNDAALGVVPFAVSIVGNVTALGVAWFCARHARTMVLAAMFVIWGVFVAVAG